MKSPNWCQRHPNGTAVIAILLAFVVAGFGSLDAVGEMALGLSALVYYFVISPYLLHAKELVFVLISLGLCLPVLGWTFWQKRGSIWWVGWIVILFLPMGWVIAVFTGRPVVKVLSFGRPIIAPSSKEGIYDIKYWRGLRQTICWAGIVILLVIVVLAETINNDNNAPLWVQVAHIFSITCVIGGFLLYGALRK